MGRETRRLVGLVSVATALLLTFGTASILAQDAQAEASPMGSAMPMEGDTMASAMPLDGGMAMDDGMAMDIGALGEAADPADADRTVSITASDQLAFDPTAIDVTLGETITFVIENTGAADHEFVLSSEAFQAVHEEEMATGAMEMSGPNEVEVPAGETASLTWHFTEPGETQYGCHVPGHYAVGMHGTITVSE